MLDRPTALKAITEEDDASGRGRSRVTLTESTLWPNFRTAVVPRGARFSLTSCVVVPFTSRDKFLEDVETASTPPEFIAPHRGDFRQKSGSPGFTGAK